MTEGYLSDDELRAWDLLAAAALGALLGVGAPDPDKCDEREWADHMAWARMEAASAADEMIVDRRKRGAR